MKIAIANTQVPFVQGGAESLAVNLKKALCDEGFVVDIITAPFKFGPPAEIHKSMEFWSNNNFSSFDAGKVDQVVCLKFPTYGLEHPLKSLWLLHQHRPVYDLWDYFEKNGHTWSEEDIELKDRILGFDETHLRSIKKRFTIADNVTERLLKYCKINANTLYHPPPLLPHNRCFDPYFLYPSRVEPLKRQELVIEALKFTKQDVKVIFTGTGSNLTFLKAKALEAGVASRVTWTGYAHAEDLIRLYSECLGVLFCPLDEDYGYVTLEAMHARKPVVTLDDSGGPVEFVQNEVSGLVCSKDPQRLAIALDRLFADKAIAKKMGSRGKEIYDSLNLSWKKVVEKIIY